MASSILGSAFSTTRRIGIQPYKILSQQLWRWLYSCLRCRLSWSVRQFPSPAIGLAKFWFFSAASNHSRQGPDRHLYPIQIKVLLYVRYDKNTLPGGRDDNMGTQPTGKQSRISTYDVDTYHWIFLSPSNITFLMYFLNANNGSRAFRKYSKKVLFDRYKNFHRSP